MWKSGWAMMERSASGSVAAVRLSSAQSCPAWVSGTPLGDLSSLTCRGSGRSPPARPRRSQRPRARRAGRSHRARRHRNRPAGPGRHLATAGAIDEGEDDAAVGEDVVDRVLRQLGVDGHRDEAAAHDAEIGGDVFGAIGGEDGDRRTARQPRLGQEPRHAAGERVDLGMAVGQRLIGLSQVDDGGAGEVAAAIDEIAEIGPARHGCLRTDQRLSRRGLRASLRPSPTRLRARTVSMTARPGTAQMYQEVGSASGRRQ